MTRAPESQITLSQQSDPHQLGLPSESDDKAVMGRTRNGCPLWWEIVKDELFGIEFRVRKTTTTGVQGVFDRDRKYRKRIAFLDTFLIVCVQRTELRGTRADHSPNSKSCRHPHRYLLTTLPRAVNPPAQSITISSLQWLIYSRKEYRPTGTIIRSPAQTQRLTLNRTNRLTRLEVSLRRL